LNEIKHVYCRGLGIKTKILKISSAPYKNLPNLGNLKNQTNKPTNWDLLTSITKEDQLDILTDYYEEVIRNNFYDIFSLHLLIHMSISWLY